jgi:serine protease Do
MGRLLRISGRLLVLAALEALLVGAVAGMASADGEAELRRNQVVRAVEKAKPAIVSVRTTKLVGQRFTDLMGLVLREEIAEVEGSLGSGVVFHPAGFVITNAHVISRAQNLYVHRAGEENGPGLRAVEFAVDFANDLAILRILPPDGGAAPPTYPYLPLGRSHDLMLGETVLAVGNPFKLGLSVSTGVLAGLDRKLNVGRRRFDDFIQVDAAINPGNSGGALLDVTGRWIGVTTAIYARATGAEGIGFAIPADRVRRLVGTAFKRRVVMSDWLGFDEGEGADGAATVARVFPRGPAMGSGLKEGDVLRSVNGMLTPTRYDFAMALLEVPVGGSVTLGLLRQGEPVAPVTLRLAPLPTEDLARRHLGLDFADVQDYEAGVVIKELAPDGPAAQRGLRVGDVIQGLGPWKIRHSDDLLLFLQYVQPGDLVDVRLLRPGPENAQKPITGHEATLRAR